MKIVYKYGTGQQIPDNAKYLCTRTETVKTVDCTSVGQNYPIKKEIVKRNAFVWHYYEVEMMEK
jgi:hypothetical protein